MFEYSDMFSEETLKSAPILVVDDEATNILLIERILSSHGYRNVISTENPKEALPLLKKHHCDLVLLDINMPVLDGFGVMEELKQSLQLELPPIIFLTAQYMQEFRQKAFDRGAYDYVTKPFDVNELLSRVNNALQVKLSHNYMLQQNEILEQKVMERTKEIHQTQLQVIRCLGLASEYKDEETGLHTIRMSKMAHAIALKTTMTEEQCQALLFAAPMHDVGKIGIPDHILLKPGKLNEDEWTIMQTHSVIGAGILAEQNSSLMKMAHDIALTHHEKWNGTGYPNKLMGEDIPLAGRVTALADVFDALTSTRPYKEAWPVEKAVALIESERGKHFDPALVDIFIDQLPTLISIKNKYE